MPKTTKNEGPLFYARQRTLTEFADRLKSLMLERGWTNSELSRQASAHCPEGRTIGRDLIGQYVKGIFLPGPINLTAIARAFGVSPSDLVPNRGGFESIPVSDLDVKNVGDGMALLQVNMRVPWATALKVLHDLEAARKEAEGDAD